MRNTGSGESIANSSLNPSAPLAQREFALLRDLVHERTGLFFEDDKSGIFLDKLSPLVLERSVDSLLDYYYILKDEPDSAGEWRKIFDALTVQESFFWREMDQIQVLVDEIVPQYFKTHPNHTLNIWSAACAAGEEPLTIAMALNEKNWFDRERINVHASDACPRALEAAQSRCYRERSFRSLPLELREKYFLGDDGRAMVSGDLHSRIRWRTANLVSDADLESAPTTSPVIFCRNVFIYFSESAARKTVGVFAARMPRFGYLFVGMAESLLKVTSDFELREIGEAFAYVRS